MNYDRVNIAMRRMDGEIIAFFPDSYCQETDQFCVYRTGRRFEMKDAELLDRLGMPTYTEYEPLLNELQAIGYAPVVLSKSYTYNQRSK